MSNAAIGKRITFVRIVVFIFCESVVPLKLITPAEPLSHAYSKAVVHRLADSAGYKYVSPRNGAEEVRFD